MDTGAMKALLLDRREALLAVSETGDEAARPVELDQARVGRLSRMDAMQAQAMAQASGRRRRVELARIAAALGRIERGEYGECRVCGETIHERRLAADPAATVCIGCAAEAERT